jgi:hypothetical protein
MVGMTGLIQTMDNTSIFMVRWLTVVVIHQLSFQLHTGGKHTVRQGTTSWLKMDVGDVNGDGTKDLMLSIGYSEQWLWLGWGTQY